MFQHHSNRSSAGGFSSKAKSDSLFFPPVLKLQTDAQSIQRQDARPAFSCPESARDVPRAASSSGRNTLDARAQAIIAIANNSALSIQIRAEQTGAEIICTYFPSLQGLVYSVQFDSRSGETGLNVVRVGAGATTRGIIRVSERYVTDLPANFARKVLQMRHELQHIQQYRSGMTGHNRQDEREFLAFYEEALAIELEGTDRMNNPTRINLIDGAIGYYFCLDPALQTQYETQYQNLLTRRSAIPPRRDSRPYGTVPNSCTRP